MTVPSFQVLGFALIAAILYRLCRPGWMREAVMLATNLLFLASFTTNVALYIPFAVFVLFGFAVVRYEQTGRRTRLWLWITATVVFFFWIKKYSVVPAALTLPFAYVTIGVSYIFFRILHLIIDTGQGTIIKRVGFVDYLNYTLNFTCIVAGPIQRYQDYKAPTEPLSLPALGEAAERIIIGLFKVMIVSSVLNAYQKQVIASVGHGADLLTRAEQAGLIVSMYPIYLFFNFSGYTDFVIGLARLFGLRLPENFDRPFTSLNFIEFWSRWHISLSNWLKSYVYNPLLMALMRRISSRTIEPFLAVFAFFTTFFLVGAWHGQTSEFLFFGLLQGGGVSVNKLYQILMGMGLGRKGYKALGANPLYAAVSRGLTFAWFGFTLLWFWSTWGQIGSLASQLGAVPILAGLLAVVVVASVVLQALIWIGSAVEAARLSGVQVWSSRYVRTSLATAMVLFIVLTVVVLDSPAPDIVYKAF